MKGALFTLAVVLCLATSGMTERLDSSVKISNARRTIDATTALCKISSSIVFENEGSNQVSEVYFAVMDDIHPRMSAITVKESVSKKALKVVKSSLENAPSSSYGAVYFKITLSTPLKGGEKITLVVKETYFDVFIPFPAKIKQKETQKFMFEFNNLLFSPYKVAAQSSVVSVPSAKVESYSKLEGASFASRKMSIKPTGEKAALSYTKGHIHYDNMGQFLSVESLDRYVEVSHWGKINVYDTVWIKHTGAELDGEFCRFEYMQSGNGASDSSIISFTTLIPKYADHIFYRDEIGNVSTSAVRQTLRNKAIDIKLRFPLFGGWKTNFVLSYQLPTHEFISVQGNDYTLKLPFLLHLADNVPYKKVNWHIVLPEMSSDLRLDIPFDVDNKEETQTVTYLDTVGRPTLNFEKSGVSEEYEVNFTLTYSFSKVMMVREPLMLIGAFFAIFLSIIVYVRLDFSIAKDARRASLGLGSSSKVGGLVESIVKIQNQRMSVYSEFDDACSEYIKTMDSAKLASAKASFDSMSSELNDKEKDIGDQVKEAGSKVYEEVKDILHVERSKQQIYDQFYNAHKRFGNRELKADAFNETCKTLKAQFEKCDDEIDSKLSFLGF
eukprot:Nk52_evm11s377 gene=Nk52_evmTU11s377